MTRKQITNPDHIRDYIFGGKATFTVVSGKTGTRFTYRISRAKGEDEGRPYFVGVLSGANNESDYTYAGFIPSDDHTKVIRGRKGRLDSKAPSIVALAWVLSAVARKPEALSKIEFWHEGRCGACGRKLTVPESIDSGLGPVCAGRSAAPAPKSRHALESAVENGDNAIAAEAKAELADLQKQADDEADHIFAEEARKEVRKCEPLAAAGDQEAIDILEHFENLRRA